MTYKLLGSNPQSKYTLFLFFLMYKTHHNYTNNKHALIIRILEYTLVIILSWRDNIKIIKYLFPFTISYTSYLLIF